MTRQHVLDLLADLSAAVVGCPVRRVVVFGSYAQGTQRPDSDVDVLVLVDAPDLARRWSPRDNVAERDRLRCDLVQVLPIPLDLWVRTLDQFAAASHVWGGPEYWAARDGVVVYDRVSADKPDLPLVASNPEVVRAHHAADWITHARDVWRSAMLLKRQTRSFAQRCRTTSGQAYGVHASLIRSHPVPATLSAPPHAAEPWTRLARRAAQSACIAVCAAARVEAPAKHSPVDEFVASFSPRHPELADGCRERLQNPDCVAAARDVIQLAAGHLARSPQVHAILRERGILRPAR